MICGKPDAVIGHWSRGDTFVVNASSYNVVEAKEHARTFISCCHVHSPPVASERKKIQAFYNQLDAVLD